MAAAHAASKAGGITGFLQGLHGPVIYAAVGFLAFAEAALLVGFVFPGETAVVAGGWLAEIHRVNLVAMIVVVVLCAIAGDSVGFEVGKHAGPWLLSKRPLRGHPGVTKTTALIERYGGPAVFLGRFVSFARALVPGLTGMSGLRYRTFLMYNAAGGLVWGTTYVLIGYVVGQSFEHVIAKIGIYTLLVVAVLVAGFVAWKVIERRRVRAAMDSGVPVHGRRVEAAEDVAVD